MKKIITILFVMMLLCVTNNKITAISMEEVVKVQKENEITDYKKIYLKSHHPMKLENIEQKGEVVYVLTFYCSTKVLEVIDWYEVTIINQELKIGNYYSNGTYLGKKKC